MKEILKRNILKQIQTQIERQRQRGRHKQKKETLSLVDIGKELSRDNDTNRKKESWRETQIERQRTLTKIEIVRH